MAGSGSIPPTPHAKAPATTTAMPAGTWCGVMGPLHKENPLDHRMQQQAPSSAPPGNQYADCNTRCCTSAHASANAGIGEPPAQGSAEPHVTLQCTDQPPHLPSRSPACPWDSESA